MNFGILLSILCLVFCGQVHAADRPVVDINCQSHGMGPLLNCSVLIKQKDGAAISNAQVMLSALMPSMPMAHTIKPVKAQPGTSLGRYEATLTLEMLGVWSVDVDISGPVRDKVSKNMMVVECPESGRCPVKVATAAEIEAEKRQYGQRRMHGAKH